ncbi:hypothetical protein PR048_008734 [Dryococelus australis]|uniref:Uncharacterized protein n=1 Tax=Dryococelus australis TaxID=614101 RepID=A0ABQ9HYS6_9NEOP|nr:hypothetical protein PR048_008734 [Dryococelus australis]
MFHFILQVQEWLDNHLCSTDWGWIVSGQSLTPVATEPTSAPDDILQLISCASAHCSCRTASLSCSMMCAHCRGRSRHNGSNSEHDEDTLGAPDGL